MHEIIGCQNAFVSNYHFSYEPTKRLASAWIGYSFLLTLYESGIGWFPWPQCSGMSLYCKGRVWGVVSVWTVAAMGNASSARSFKKDETLARDISPMSQYASTSVFMIWDRFWHQPWKFLELCLTRSHLKHAAYKRRYDMCSSTRTQSTSGVMRIWPCGIFSAVAVPPFTIGDESISILARVALNVRRVS